MMKYGITINYYNLIIDRPSYKYNFVVIRDEIAHNNIGDTKQSRLESTTEITQNKHVKVLHYFVDDIK